MRVTTPVQKRGHKDETLQSCTLDRLHACHQPSYIEFGTDIWSVRIGDNGRILETFHDCSPCKAQPPQRLRLLDHATFDAIVAAARGEGLYSWPDNLKPLGTVEPSHVLIRIGGKYSDDPAPAARVAAPVVSGSYSVCSCSFHGFTYVAS